MLSIFRQKPPKRKSIPETEIPEWVTRCPCKMISFNTYLSYKDKLGVDGHQNKHSSKTICSSAVMLYKTINDNNNLLNIVNHVYDTFGAGQIVFGVKNDNNGHLRHELYRYCYEEIDDHSVKTGSGIKINHKSSVEVIQLIQSICEKNGLLVKPSSNDSIDKSIISQSHMISFDYQADREYSDIDYYCYQETTDIIKFPLYSNMYNRYTSQIRGTYVIDKYINIKNNLRLHMERIGLNLNLFKVVKKTLKKYYEKDNNNMILIQKGAFFGVGWFGMSHKMFIRFLKENKWSLVIGQSIKLALNNISNESTIMIVNENDDQPENFIQFCKINKHFFENFKHEVIAHYDENGNVIRTAFYGVI